MKIKAISQTLHFCLLTYHWCIPLVLHPKAALSLTKWVLKRYHIMINDHHHNCLHHHHDVWPATQARIQDSTGLGPAPRWEEEGIVRKWELRRIRICLFDLVSYHLSWWAGLAKIPFFWEQVFYALRRQDEQNWKDSFMNSNDDYFMYFLVPFFCVKEH